MMSNREKNALYNTTLRYLAAGYRVILSNGDSLVACGCKGGKHCRVCNDAGFVVERDPARALVAAEIPT